MTVSGSCAFGILVGGNNNQVDTNVATANGDGIMLAPATGALITANDTSGNVRAGIAISDVSDGNVVRGNISNGNGGTGEGYGIALFNGTNAIIEDNVANKNDFGLRLSGIGAGTFVRRNTMNGSTSLGVFVTADVAPISIKLNTVLGSGVADMSDDSPGCGANVWRKNTFQTDLVAGVPNGGPGGGCLK